MTSHVGIGPCLYIAAARDASGFYQRTWPPKGMARQEAQSVVGVASEDARAPRGAPIAAVTAPGPASIPDLSVRDLTASFWRGLVVAPGGVAPMPPGSFTANEARGRRTPSRHHERLARTPFNGRGGRIVRQVLRAGISFAIQRHSGASRNPGQQALCVATLDTGFRRYDDDGGAEGYPAILEKSATVMVVARIRFRSRRRFSRSLGSSALTVTLSKKASTGARSLAI